MSFDPVPLAIGQGAVLQDEVFRVAANAFTRDTEGIILPGQMKVTALGTPGPAVQIADGGVVIRNFQKAGESYVGRAGSATQVSIAPNSSGSTRRDLIIARIIDPDYAPWQPSGTPGAPNVSVPDGPYFQPFVVSGVGPTTTRASQVVSYSAFALARIDIPPSTTNITNAMIVDLRALAQARLGFAFDVQSIGSTQDMLVTDTAWKDWPLNSLQVYVPRWATHCQVAIRYAGIKVDQNGSDIDTAVSLGGARGPSTHFDYNGNAGTPVGFAEVLPWQAYGEFDVRAVQDSTVTVKPQAQRVFTANTGRIWVDSPQLIEFDCRFSERVV